MKAHVLYAVGDLRWTEVAEPVLAPGEVLVRVRAAGICGSDVARVFKTGTYHFPTIIGHEFSGEVCKVYDAVTQSRLLGKRVGVFPLKPCFRCENCRKGMYELCIDYDYLGSRCDGGFGEYVAVPEWNLLELPGTVSFLAGAMIEPASVAMHALRQSGFCEGEYGRGRRTGNHRDDSLQAGAVGWCGGHRPDRAQPAQARFCADAIRDQKCYKFHNGRCAAAGCGHHGRSRR